jgi:hypothetical protein
VQTLRALGWSVRVEYSFNDFGDRGSVDVLAWHPAERVLLIVEVKTRLTDLQAMLSSLGRKIRIVPRLVREDPGWIPRRIARLLVVAGTTASSARLDRSSAASGSSPIPGRPLDASSGSGARGPGRLPEPSRCSPPIQHVDAMQHRRARGGHVGREWWRSTHEEGGA